MIEQNYEEKEFLLEEKNKIIFSRENDDNINLSEILTKTHNSSYKQKISNSLQNKNEENAELLIEKNKSNLQLWDIKCPKCEESCKIDIYDYQISLFGCKNNHKTNNIFFREYEYTQITKKKEIICDNCKKTFNEEFYLCQNCKIILCFLCRQIHDKTHFIVNYKDKKCICNEHCKFFISYCKTCKNDLCELCEREHKDHKIIKFSELIPRTYNLMNKNNELNSAINILKNNIKEIKLILDDVIKNLEIYYQIFHDYVYTFDDRKLNYELLYNINKIEQNNDNILKVLNKINNDDSIGNKINIIYDIYKNNNIKKPNEIEIKYKINKNENKVKLFGKDFVSNNKSFCKILYDDKYYDLQENFEIKNIENNTFTIVLRGIKYITDMSYMFYLCTSLIELPDISKLDTSDITNLSYLFKECKSLVSLPDISKWDTSNVEYMTGIFDSCESLISIPDISKWNTYKVIGMGFMFSGCASLKCLPDLSKWDTSKVIDMGYMFSNCMSLKNLPDLSKWDTSLVHNMRYMFHGCKSLMSLPDISKWNTRNLEDKNCMFYGCNKLLLLNIPKKFKGKWYDGIIEFH